MTATDRPPFLETGRLNELTLRNRLVRAAMGESMADDSGEANAGHARLYGDLARGGAGLIITGHIFVEPRGQYAARQLGLHDDRCIPALERVTREVHEAGGAIFAELSHAGSQSVMPGFEPLAPSVVANAMFARRPRAMGEADIEDAIEAFGAAAGRAMRAGFDGIHIHSGNGYLLAQFNSPLSNLRTDRWGGSAERRGRFLLEVFQAVRRAVGESTPVTARIGIADAVKGGLEVRESLDRIRLLRFQGLDGVETTYGLMNTYLENIRPYVALTFRRALADCVPHRIFARPGPEAYYRPFARAVKSEIDIPVILVGGLRTTETMAEVIGSGDADFIAMARPLLREPDLPRQFESGRRGVVDCVSCNICLAHEGKDGLRCWRKSWRDLAFHAYCRFWRDR
ncbi:MAG: hypothetical protein AB7S41_03765 [Parvibaculaceae bacterium]